MARAAPARAGARRAPARAAAWQGLRERWRLRGLVLRLCELRRQRIGEVGPGVEDLVKLAEERRPFGSGRAVYRWTIVEIGRRDLRRKRPQVRASVAGRRVIEGRRALGQPGEQQRAACGGEADRPRLLGELCADQAAQLAVLRRASDAALHAKPERIEVDVLPRGVALERFAHVRELGRELLGGRRTERLRVEPRLEQLDLSCGEIRLLGGEIGLGVRHVCTPLGCALIVGRASDLM